MLRPLISLWAHIHTVAGPFHVFVWLRAEGVRAHGVVPLRKVAAPHQSHITAEEEGDGEIEYRQPEEGRGLILMWVVRIL